MTHSATSRVTQLATADVWLPVTTSISAC